MLLRVRKKMLKIISYDAGMYREYGAVHISMPFVEESFDPGDMLIINDTHFDTTGALELFRGIKG